MIFDSFLSYLCSTASVRDSTAARIGITTEKTVFHAGDSSSVVANPPYEDWHVNNTVERSSPWLHDDKLSGVAVPSCHLRRGTNPGTRIWQHLRPRARPRPAEAIVVWRPVGRTETQRTDFATEPTGRPAQE